jgi:hypothetical protein
MVRQVLQVVVFMQFRAVAVVLAVRLDAVLLMFLDEQAGRMAVAVVVVAIAAVVVVTPLLMEEVAQLG